MKMKKYVGMVIAGMLSFSPAVTKAQLTDQKNADWYNCSFGEDGVYGAAVNKAYQFLKGRELKKSPVIAFIGTGMDVEHEDLKHAIWVNPHPERGDVNGWNFIGGRDGEMLVTTPSVANREYARLKDLYAGLLFSDGKYWTIKDDKVVEYDAPVNGEEFKHFEFMRQTHTSDLMDKRYSLNLMYFMRDYIARADQGMKAKHPGKELMKADFIAWGAENSKNGIRMDSMCFHFSSFNYGMQEQYAKGPIPWERMFKYYTGGDYFNFCRENYEKALKYTDFDIRKRVVGDDYLDLKDDKYGNDNLFSAACQTEVMRASIAVGKRGNGLGADGIADFAKVMSLCVYPEKGEPYGKDLILSLRYAVDHGADIVVMAYQLRISTPMDRKGLLEALQYAESKNVLVIIPAWEAADDMDEGGYYPNRFMGEKELTNLLIVSPSDETGNPAISSNYGLQQVDLYAPGVRIYAASTGDTYLTASGTALSAGTVAGVAALVKGYYPNLTAGQLRELLIGTVTSRKGVEVEKSARANGQAIQDLFLFDELCVSGGIVNAYNAVVAADKMEK